MMGWRRPDSPDMTRRLLTALVLVPGVIAATPGVAWAHGGDHEDVLPVSGVLIAWLAAVLIALTGIALLWWWPRPRLAARASGRPLGDRARRSLTLARPVLQVIGLVGFLIVVIAALWGSRLRVLNIAPLAAFVGFWVGLQLVASLVGDIYRVLSPFRSTLGWSQRLTGWPREHTGLEAPGQWTAAILLLSFSWLASAHYDTADPRALGYWLVAYSALVVIGAGLWGRAWLLGGTAFGALFDMIGHMAPYGIDAGRFVRRPLLSGLTKMRVGRGTAALVMVAIGATVFDGVSGTDLWAEIRGDRTDWALTLVDSIGLVWFVTLTWAAYLIGARLSAQALDADPIEIQDEFLPGLVPMVVGLTIAHYLPLLVLDGRDLVSLVSDPFGEGWDLFGTRSMIFDDDAVSPLLLGWLQVLGLLLAQTASAVVLHDRVVERVDSSKALRVSAPLLGVVLLYSVGGVLSLGA